MTQKTYDLLENYMLSCVADTVHDQNHIYRVLYNALDIARTEPRADMDVLIAACLLHDIGRREQLENPKVCHAQAGAEKASAFLMEHGFDEAFVKRVASCIRTHRYRATEPPESIEAKILFDADKLDVAGAIGIARTLMYKGVLTEPLYTLLPDGGVSDGSTDAAPSFFQEYQWKLTKLYGKFFTERGAALAGERQAAAVSFYESLLSEVQIPYREGNNLLRQLLKEEHSDDA